MRKISIFFSWKKVPFLNLWFGLLKQQPCLGKIMKGFYTSANTEKLRPVYISAVWSGSCGTPDNRYIQKIVFSHLCLYEIGFLPMWETCTSHDYVTFWNNSLNSFPASGNFCRLLITFANSLDPDQALHLVGPDLDPNCLTLWWYTWKIFLKNLI